MRRPPNRQRGVAIITALLLTTLAVTIVASLFWQQQVQVRSMENQRLHLQTKWILRGALDWVRLILRQDASDSGGVTTLNAVWATPLAETRLDQYIERERLDGEKFDATLSGQVTDAQARYNLANLATNRVANAGQVKVFGRLLQNLGLDSSLAQRAADALKLAQSVQAAPQQGSGGGGTSGTPAPAGDGTAPLEFTQVDDLLAVPGFTPQVVERLRDYVIVLPSGVPALTTGGAMTAVNLNTAPAEVLAAVYQMSVGEAQALVSSRKTAYFMAINDTRLGGKAPVDQTVLLDVKSGYFLVQSYVRLDRAALDAQSLIRRGADGSATLLWTREQ